MDRQDEQALLSAYWPDGLDDHGMFQGSPQELVEYVKSAWPSMKMQHFLGQNYMVIDGNIANVETYFYAHHRFEGEQARQALIGGRYLDRLERRGESWKISKKTVIYDWYKDLGDCPAWDNTLFPFANLPRQYFGSGISDPSWELFKG
jgi:hypothetical protein